MVVHKGEGADITGKVNVKDNHCYGNAEVENVYENRLVKSSLSILGTLSK
jgi:hypothetical protein